MTGTAGLQDCRTAMTLTAVVPTRGRRICIYAHISMYLRAFSSAWAPRGALSLRFPVFGGLGRSELTFSNVSGPPDAPILVFVRVGAPPEIK